MPYLLLVAPLFLAISEWFWLTYPFSSIDIFIVYIWRMYKIKFLCPLNLKMLPTRLDDQAELAIDD